MHQIHLKLYGKVQGVWFRDSARQQAVKNNLLGWIKNLPEGTVEILAQGEKINLEHFLEWCKEGPKHAEVKNIDISWEKINEPEFKTFQIIY